MAAAGCAAWRWEVVACSLRTAVLLALGACGILVARAAMLLAGRRERLCRVLLDRARLAAIAMTNLGTKGKLMQW